MVVAQSGGPSPVINNSLRGIIETARETSEIGTVYGGYHGIEGVLKEELLDLSAQARQLVDYTAQTYESFIAVTLAYVLINLVVMGVMRLIEQKTRLPGYVGGK